jgi:hypothetical protein
MCDAFFTEPFVSYPPIHKNSKLIKSGKNIFFYSNYFYFLFIYLQIIQIDSSQGLALSAGS